MQNTEDVIEILVVGAEISLILISNKTTITHTSIATLKSRTCDLSEAPAPLVYRLTTATATAGS